MLFRLIVSEAPDLTTIRVAGRLRDDAVMSLNDACGAARRPLVLDLSELTGASEAGALLLSRLGREGVHLVGESPFVRLLLAHATGLQESTARSPRRAPPPWRTPRKAGSRPRPRS